MTAKSRWSRLIGLFLLMASAAMVPSASACSVCGGDPAAPMARGLFMGIFVLLGFIGSILAAFAWFFIRIGIRSRAALPPSSTTAGRSSHALVV